MPNQNQQGQELTLEDRLVHINGIFNIKNDIKKYSGRDRDVEKTSQLYLSLAKILALGDARAEDELYRNIRISPEVAMDYSKQGLDVRVNAAKSHYEEGKDKIIKAVLNSMTDTIGLASNKGEAAFILSKYFTGLFGDVPDLDQITANEYARNEVQSDTMVKRIYDVQGKISKYKEAHEHNTLAQRILAADYLKDIKDKEGKVINYEINKDKVKEKMNDVLSASVLYGNAVSIERGKAQQQGANRRTS